MGTTPIAWNIPKTDTSTLNVNLGGYKPSVGSEVVGSLASIGTMLTMGILSNAIQGKGKQTPVNPKSDPTIEQTANESIKAAEGEIDKLQRDNKVIDGEITTLEEKTNDTLIEQKRAHVNELHDNLYGKDGKKTDGLAQKIDAATKALNSSKVIQNNATTKWTNANSALASLQSEKTNIDSLVDSAPKTADGEKEDPQITQAKARQTELKTLIEQKDAEVKSAAKEKEQAELDVKNKQANLDKIMQNSDGTTNTEALDIKSKMAEYNKESSELKDMDDNKTNNLKTLQDKRAEKTTNEQKILADQATITTIQNKLMSMKGAQVRQDGTDAKNYSKGDASDGNWFSRTFGSKSTRTAQKEAHKEKETAITDYMSSHGCTRKEAEKALEGIEADNKKSNAPAQTVKIDTATESTETRALNFIINNGSKGYDFSNSTEIEQYIKHKQDATDSDIIRDVKPKKIKLFNDVTSTNNYG